MNVKWQPVFESVRKILIHWDPLGLVEGGAPENEFDDYARSITSILINKKTTENIMDFFLEEMGPALGVNFNQPELNPVIEELLKIPVE